jgi:NADH dehydrogenase [ubiquinone] 1 alpha subcomplex assembly factor 1
MKTSLRLLCLLLSPIFFPMTASAQTLRSLFEFADSSEASKWQIVNDGVMGGRSSSQASIIATSDRFDVLRFKGNLSLENNGGFASVRSRPAGSLGLDAGDTIVIRVQGDGREYTFNLYTPNRRTAFSYQMDFKTKAGQWLEVRLPVDKFVAHSFGRQIPSMQLTPDQVQSIGILLGDKKPGAFELLVDWIKVE